MLVDNIIEIENNKIESNNSMKERNILTGSANEA